MDSTFLDALKLVVKFGECGKLSEDDNDRLAAIVQYLSPQDKAVIDLVFVSLMKP